MKKLYLFQLLLITNLSFGYDINSFHTVKTEECTLLISKKFRQNPRDKYYYEYFDNNSTSTINGKFYLITNNYSQENINSIISTLKIGYYSKIEKNIKGFRVIEFTSNFSNLKDNKHYLIIGKRFILNSQS